MMSWSKWLYALAITCVVPLLLTGCGGTGDQPEVAPVHGTVTLDGEPLPDAEVRFQPEEGRPSEGRTDKKGHYELQYTPDTPGAKVGRHEVTISTKQTVYNEESEVEKKVPEKVPAQYNTNTQLTKKVEAGENEINFELQSQ